MKLSILFLSLSLLSSAFSIAQTEKPEYKKVAATFEQNYNDNNHEAIFASFNDLMKSRVPMDKLQHFLTSLKTQAGAIVKREFINYEQDAALYKTTFEKATFGLYIATTGNDEISGLLIKPYKDTSNTLILERNTTSMILPFNDEWTVFWGGDTVEQNYHVESKPQKNAFDFVITDTKGNSYKTDGMTNEDYYAFGKPLIAPADAEVVLVVDGIKDNTPGDMNPVYVPGNTVILKTAANEYLFFAHFKQHSIVVKQGQTVKQGDLLGLCGNSGNSSEPHLHFHIQNIEEIKDATGAKCYFEAILVNGALKKDYSPVKGELIKNK